MKMYRSIFQYMKEHVVTSIITVLISAFIAVYISGIFAQAAYSIGHNGYHMTAALLPNIRYGIRAGILPVIIFLFLASLILAMIVVATGEYETVSDKGYTRSNSGIAGTAGVMSKSEMTRILSLRTIDETAENILGNYGSKCVVYEPKKEYKPNKHTFVCATNGAGKTTGQVIPRIIQAVRRGESVIVTDPKGEVYAQTAYFARQSGYTVRVLNLKNAENSDGCDFLSIFKHPVGDKVETTQKLTRIIVDNCKTKTDFWSEQAEKLLQIAILRVMDGTEIIGTHGRTLRTVFDLCMKPTKEMVSYFLQLPNDHPAKLMAEDFSAATDTVKDSARSGVTTMLRVLLAESVTKMVTHDDIDFALPGQEKCIYYTVTSDQDSSKNWLAALFYGCLFLALVEGLADRQPERKVPVPVNMIFDEFPNIARIPDFQAKLSTVRSRDISVTIIAQNIAQMEEKFPEEWRSIIEACDTNIYMGTNDIQVSAKFYSDMTGEMTVKNPQDAIAKGIFLPKIVTSYTERSGVSRRMALTPDEIRRLDPNKEIVFMKGQKPLILDKFFMWYYPQYKEWISNHNTPAEAHEPIYKSRTPETKKAPEKNSRKNPGRGGLFTSEKPEF